MRFTRLRNQRSGERWVGGNEVQLRLRGLAGAIATVAVVMAGSWSPVATATERSDWWTVTVGPSSRQLSPGTDATMSYDVRNATAGPLRLQGTTAVVQVKGDSACRAEWFRIGSNTVPTDVEVAPGDTVHGSLVLAFDNAPASQDACQNTGLEVVVTAV